MRFKDLMSNLGDFVIENAPKVLDYARENHNTSVKNYERETDRKINDLEKRVSSAESSASNKTVLQKEKIKEARQELERKKEIIKSRRE